MREESGEEAEERREGEREEEGGMEEEGGRGGREGEGGREGGREGEEEGRKGGRERNEEAQKYKCMCKPRAGTHHTCPTGREVREGERGRERVKGECEEKRGTDLW